MMEIVPVTLDVCVDLNDGHPHFDIDRKTHS